MSNGNSKITEPLNPHLENEKSEKNEFTVKKRDQWSSKLEFILSCVGYAIGKNFIFMIKKIYKKNSFKITIFKGLGNVWRYLN